MKTFSRTHHAQQRLSLQRRVFLTAIGLGLAAPTALRFSRAALAVPENSRPTRLFIYFTPHGAPVEHYEPGDGMNLETGEGVLAPLEPFKNYLTVLRGVDNTLQTNHDAIQSVLTGSVDETDSVDYLVARELGTSAHVLGCQSYRRSSPGPDFDSKLARHGAYVTPIQNPADAIDDLFAGIAASDNPEAQQDADFRREAIELTEREVEALRTKLKGLTSEENKLSIHLESLAALKASQGGPTTEVSCDVQPALPTARAMADRDPFDEQYVADIVDGHLEAVAHAFLCGTARVATLQNLHSNTELMMSFPGGPGVEVNHHPLSHAFQEPERGQFARCQRWFYERLAEKFLTVLDVPDPLDPAHTVLDNTTIFACTEIADGMLHNTVSSEDLLYVNNEPHASYLPWNIIGGGGGFFQGGRVVTMDGIDHRHLLAAVAESMGVSLGTINGLSVSTPRELMA